MARELLTAFPGTFPPHAPNAKHLYAETLYRVLGDGALNGPAVDVITEMTRITYLAAVKLARLSGGEPDDALADLFAFVSAFDARDQGGA